MVVSESSPAILERYLTLLERWNQTHALTSLDVTERQEELILDASALLPHLAHLPAGSHVVDFGSGAGIPAVVLAVHRPDLHITALDAVQKKIAFIQQVALELKLGNLTAQHGRAELLPPLGASVGVAKAVGSPRLLAAWMDHHRLPGGFFLALKSQDWMKEDLPLDWSCTPHVYQLPTRGSRVVLRMDPVAR
jgi:16S rRNA (guanine527-N7)-methyltransferase